MSLERTHDAQKALEKMRDKLRRKAAVIDKHGNVAILMSYPISDELDEDSKATEVVVIDIAPGDEKDWMDILESVWEVKPLDTVAGRQKHPELYL